MRALVRRPAPAAPRRMRAGGFTMIEVLVALAIIAIALAASVRAVGSVANSTRELHARLLAGWSADNALAELRLTHAWPDLGETNFDCPQGNLPLQCTREVLATPNPIFRRVEITVRTADQHSTLAHMVTVIADETHRSL